MPKQCLVSQLYTNYITKIYFITGLLFQDHILKFHDFFSTKVLIQDFSRSEKSKMNFRTSGPVGTLVIAAHCYLVQLVSVLLSTGIVSMGWHDSQDYWIGSELHVM